MTITTRDGKGSALTHDEMDENLTDLDARTSWINAATDFGASATAAPTTRPR